METGTQILIDRMKSHPEEFGVSSGISKWGRVWAYAMEHLPDEDKQALKEANRLMRIERFNEMVMTTLAGEPEEETLIVKADGRYAMGWHDPRTTLISGSNGTEPSAFGAVPVKAEGQAVIYDTYTHKSYP